jgi:hypothetical protein
MSALFVASAVVLLGMSVVQIIKRRVRRATAYLGLTLLACVVAAGFYLIRSLI